LIVIRGPHGPTLVSVQYTIDPFPLANNSFAVNVNGPVSPSNSQLYSQPLDPWSDYSIKAMPNGVGFNFTMIDLYHYGKASSSKGSKANVGAIAGGVVRSKVELTLGGRCGRTYPHRCSRLALPPPPSCRQGRLLGRKV
jgi:hypothetical protein